jgi:hypothetical protein
MRPRALLRMLVAAAGVGLTASCGGDGSGGAQASDSAGRSVSAPASEARLGAHTAAELDTAARRVVAFLRGETPADSIRLADTVTLYVAPEGGGTRTPFTRAHLRDRSNWRVPGLGRAVYSLAPPAASTKLTTRVGRHLNCMEYPLSSRFAQLARLPHVGAKLEPPGASSCLQTWNLTVVFDPTRKPPTLVAAVYDQWEW